MTKYKNSYQAREEAEKERVEKLDEKKYKDVINTQMDHEKRIKMARDERRLRKNYMQHLIKNMGQVISPGKKGKVHNVKVLRMA